MEHRHSSSQDDNVLLIRSHERLLQVICGASAIVTASFLSAIWELPVDSKSVGVVQTYSVVFLQAYLILFIASVTALPMLSWMVETFPIVPPEEIEGYIHSILHFVLTRLYLAGLFLYTRCGVV